MVAAEIAPSDVDAPAVGAGFWLRAAAWLIDYPFLAALVFATGYLAGTFYPPIIPHYYALALVGFLLWGSYFVFFESSPLRATPGKFACGLVVVADRSFARISLARAAGRFAAKCIPLILPISALTIAFGHTKRAVYDNIADCIVMRRSKLTLALNTSSGAEDAGIKTCPMCAEQVNAAAKVCRFCHYRLDGASSKRVIGARIAIIVASCIVFVIYAAALPEKTQPENKSSASEKMRIEITRDGSDRKYLHLVGVFVAGDSARIVSQIKLEAPQFVVFDSVGGSIDDAIVVGKFIRLKDISTFVDNGEKCSSACVLAFIGGSARYASSGSKIGVHQSSFPTEISFQTAAEHIIHLKEYVGGMGVSSVIVDVGLDTPPEKMHYFTLAELEEFKVAKVIQGK
jgi:uncharacterized RDD family membrane protein YckC